MPTCSQPKCRIAETGVCLEGHKQGCPHILPESASTAGIFAEAPNSGTNSPAEPEPYRFYSGEKLTVVEASRIMNDVPVTMVLCAGAQWAGKTTFLARIGEMFRSGSFQSFRFAGSRTLCAFERVSWLATISSGATRPDTVRSRRTEKDTFFHLRVRPAGNMQCCTDILISDLPGEDFPTALASREFCKEQRALARADHLILFVDCRSLIDKAKRHSEQDNAKQFLSQVARSRHDPKTLQVHVVFSRWDYVTRDELRQTHEGFCRLIEVELRERFGQTFGALRFSPITARPDEMLAIDSGVQSVFSHWMEPASSPSALRQLRNPKPERDFCAFGLI